MQLTSGLAIYLLFWVMAAFVVMPFGIRTHNETGEGGISGQADSAPVNFRPLQVIVRATLLSAAVFALFYANYRAGWITVDDLDFVQPPEDIAARQYEAE